MLSQPLPRHVPLAQLDGYLGLQAAAAVRCTVVSFEVSFPRIRKQQNVLRFAVRSK